MYLLAELATILCVLYSLALLAIFIGLLRRNHGDSKTKYRVSVLIAARNEESNIGNVLADLCRQTYPTELYEVIVASDGSSDKTEEIVRRAAAQCAKVKLVVVKQCPRGYSPKKHAIESAFRYSQGEIILATDADCRLGERWVESMVSYFTPQVGFVIGFSQFGRKGEPQNFLERLQAFDFLQLMGAAAGTCNLGSPLAASGQNLGYRREAFVAVGGYSKVAHRVSGDDVLLLQLIRTRTRWKILFASAPEAFAISAPQHTFAELMNQRKRWASNGSYQLFMNIPFFTYLLLVFLSNAVLLFGLPLSLLTGFALKTFALSAITKLFAEGIIAWRSATLFDRKDLLKYFPAWFFLQMPYVVIVGLLGSFAGFKWKGRKHMAMVTEAVEPE